MTLLLSNDDAAALLDIGECMDALAQAYSDVAAGRAVSGTRGEILSPGEAPDSAYQLKTMSSTVPSLGMSSVRINSDILTWPVANGKRRRVKAPLAPGDRWTGLVILFSAHTGEPLAIFPDGVAQRMRVAAASGLGVRHMAREDARHVALVGTGWQAGSQALAVAAAREIEILRCYSPDKARREAFCRKIAPAIDAEVIAADSAEAAVEGADIVLCATNSLDPVFETHWLVPGMHLGTIRDGELPPETIRACDRIAIHDPKSLSTTHYETTRGLEVPDMTKQVAESDTLDFLSGVPTIFDLVAGKATGRASRADITCFLNLRGLAVQFTAVGAALYAKARAAGAGRELPTEWFTEDVHP